MSENTNIALIQKHGFRNFIECNYGGCENQEGKQPSRDVEKTVVSGYVKPGKIYDLGCGSSKTVPDAIGIDRVPMGDEIPHLNGALSAADLVGDVSEDLPIDDESADTIITRHILEHCIDPVKTMNVWIRKLKPDGRIIVTLPDERIGMTIPMNPEHRHAYTPDSLDRFMKLLGMKQVDFSDKYNGISFTSVYEKNGKH
jgi:predicted SAM-dependent methyltransferase